jgi:hypothetical protein
MTRNRSKPQRHLTFESLEGRLALSAGMGMAVASHNAHEVHISQMQKSIPASFKGHAQLIGSELTTTNLRGTIGTDHFTGSGTGTEVGRQFEGGTVNLSNSHGTVQFSLAPSVVIKKGKSTRQEVSLVAVAGTGKYAAYVGITGTLTSWNVPAKPSASANFGGTLSG